MLSILLLAYTLFLTINTESIPPLFDPDREQRILQKVLKNYDHRVRPPGLNTTIPGSYLMLFIYR
jgi:hypothetical protein